MARTTVIEDKLAAWLAALPAVAAQADGRVYPWAKVPQNCPTPYLTYHRVAGPRLNTLKGPTAKVSYPTIQLDAWGTYTQAKVLGDAVRQALEQDLPGTEIGGHFVQAVRVVDRDDADPPLHGDEQAECRVILDATIWFEEVSAS